MPTLKQEELLVVWSQELASGSDRIHCWLSSYLPTTTVPALSPSRSVDSHGGTGTAPSLSRYTTAQLGVSARTRTIIAVPVLSGRCHMSFRSAVSGRPHYLNARDSVSEKLTVAFKTTINLDYIQGVPHTVCCTSACYYISHIMLYRHMPDYEPLRRYEYFNVAGYCAMLYFYSQSGSLLTA